MDWMTWYNSLIKPDWTPAPRVIGTIWQILYPVIIVSFGYVFLQAYKRKVAWYVALPFVINLIANILFTTIQFGMRNMPLACADIYIVLSTIIWCIIIIWPLSKWVAIAQIPYLIWVSIATVLQTFITLNN